MAKQKRYLFCGNGSTEKSEETTITQQFFANAALEKNEKFLEEGPDIGGLSVPQQVNALTQQIKGLINDHLKDIQGAKSFKEMLDKKDLSKINIDFVGHSRGSTIQFLAILNAYNELSKELSDNNKVKIGDVEQLLTQIVDVHIIALDPVAGPLDNTKTCQVTIAPLVKDVTIISALEEMKSPFDNPYPIGMQLLNPETRIKVTQIHADHMTFNAGKENNANLIAKTLANFEAYRAAIKYGIPFNKMPQLAHRNAALRWIINNLYLTWLVKLLHLTKIIKGTWSSELEEDLPKLLEKNESIEKTIKPFLEKNKGHLHEPKFWVPGKDSEDKDILRIELELYAAMYQHDLDGGYKPFALPIPYLNVERSASQLRGPDYYGTYQPNALFVNHSEKEAFQSLYKDLYDYLFLPSLINTPEGKTKAEKKLQEMKVSNPDYFAKLKKFKTYNGEILDEREQKKHDEKDLTSLFSEDTKGTITLNSSKLKCSASIYEGRTPVVDKKSKAQIMLWRSRECIGRYLLFLSQYEIARSKTAIEKFGEYQIALDALIADFQDKNLKLNEQQKKEKSKDKILALMHAVTDSLQTSYNTYEKMYLLRLLKRLTRIYSSNGNEIPSLDLLPSYNSFGYFMIWVDNKYSDLKRFFNWGRIFNWIAELFKKPSKEKFEKAAENLQALHNKINGIKIEGGHPIIGLIDASIFAIFATIGIVLLTTAAVFFTLTILNVISLNLPLLIVLVSIAILTAGVFIAGSGLVFYDSTHRQLAREGAIKNLTEIKETLGISKKNEPVKPVPKNEEIKQENKNQKESQPKNRFEPLKSTKNMKK